MSSSANDQGDLAIEVVTVRCLACFTTASYSETIKRFHALVPKLDLAGFRAATSLSGIQEVIRQASSPSGFVQFMEFDHGRWLQHCPPPHEAGSNQRERGQGHQQLGLHRFTFGNPLYAMEILQQNPDAAMSVPLDGCIAEQPDGTCKISTVLPGDLMAGLQGPSSESDLRAAVNRLADRVKRLMAALADRNA